MASLEDRSPSEHVMTAVAQAIFLVSERYFLVFPRGFLDMICGHFATKYPSLRVEHGNLWYSALKTRVESTKKNWKDKKPPSFYTERNIDSGIKTPTIEVIRWMATMFMADKIPERTSVMEAISFSVKNNIFTHNAALANKPLIDQRISFLKSSQTSQESSRSSLDQNLDRNSETEILSDIGSPAGSTNSFMSSNALSQSSNVLNE